ncbi:MAG: hypothetical protein IKK04_01185 [Bacteroidales bacterium]|jgi:hypothetical protein|nr:hypothetical protein [Bacteroidales bacterium]
MEKSLEDRICDEMCDVLDDPEVYEDCVLGINKKTLQVNIANPSGFTKDYDIYPLNSFLTNNEEDDVDLDLAEIRYVASRYE